PPRAGLSRSRRRRPLTATAGGCIARTAVARGVDDRAGARARWMRVHPSGPLAQKIRLKSLWPLLCGGDATPRIASRGGRLRRARRTVPIDRTAGRRGRERVPDSTPESPPPWQNER